VGGDVRLAMGVNTAVGKLARIEESAIFVGETRRKNAVT
jgi:hypothetical protein